MRLTRLSLFAFLGVKLATGTAIVAALFPDAIYIAADSRYTAAAGDAPATSDGCKIVRTRDVVFAAASLSKDSKTGFDFYAITRQALLRAKGSLAMRLDVVDGQLVPRMRENRSRYPPGLPGRLRVVSQRTPRPGCIRHLGERSSGAD